MALIELENLTYTYPGQIQPALNQVSFCINSGECLGLLGHNGAGKTTLLSIISGLQSPTSGRLKKKPGLQLGLVPQSLAFYARLTVAENLQLFADLYRLKDRERKERLEQVIGQTHLKPKLACPAAQLSGGEQRRLNFALGILQPADLYLLDEATVGVDASSRNTMLTAVETLTAGGAGVIYTSHYLDEIERLASRILLLEAGGIKLNLLQSELRHDSSQLQLDWPDGVPTALPELLARRSGNATLLARSMTLAPATTRDLLELLAALPQDCQPTGIHFGNPRLEQIYLAATQGRNKT